MRLSPRAWFVVVVVLGIATVVFTRPADDGAPAEPAWWWLAEEPSPDDEVLRLSVVEVGCASGQPADGRVEADTLVRGDELRVLVEVRPLDGDQSCPGNPVTPHEVRLREPLGAKHVVAVGCPVHVAPPDDVGTGPGCTG